MGDGRFDLPYKRLQGNDRVQVINAMSDDDVISALSAASRDKDPYLANVLATVAHNRMRKARAVSEKISEGLCTLDSHGRVQQINPRGGELLGVSAEEVVGKDFHAIVHPHHALGVGDGSACDLDDILGTDAVARSDGTFASPRGTLAVHVSVTAILTDEAVEGRIVLFEDVSQRRAHEGLLLRQSEILDSAVQHSLAEVRRRREAEEMFRQLFEASPDASIVTDQNDRIVLMNGSAHAITGYGEEAVGLPADLLLDPSPDASNRRWSELISGHVVVVRRPDRTNVLVEVATSAFVGPNGQTRLVTLRKVAERPKDRP